MSEAAAHARDRSATWDTQERIVQAVYDAIDEVNESPCIVEPLEKSPDTVLIGDGRLDSLAFVTFVTSLEENLQRTLGAPVSVIDLVTEDLEYCTVGRLASRISQWIDSHARS